MPFGISENQPDCAGWATVKQADDGTYLTIGCHDTKQDAVDQMVVVSMSEEIDPIGDISNQRAITSGHAASRTEDTEQVMLTEMNEITLLPETHWCTKGGDERRIAYTNLEMREDGDGTHFVGYAAIFDSPSEPMPFIEYVKRGAFSKTINDGADVRLLINHEGVPLARSKSGTMTLIEDERGLKVMADLDPSNPDAARVMSAMRRGDISQMSFAFRTIQDKWSDDKMVRELREVQLFDVSVVTYPAYEQTIIELRNAMPANVTPPTTAISVRLAQIAIARHR